MRARVKAVVTPALLVVLPFCLFGPYTRSFPVTRLSSLKLADNATRTRQWAFYDWEHEDWSASHFEALDVMEIDGRVIDGSNWRFVRSIYAPTAGRDSRARGVDETQRSSRGFLYRWTSLHGFFHAPPDARRVEMRIRSIAATFAFSASRHGTSFSVLEPCYTSHVLVRPRFPNA